jgi:transglutaminase-like putative cysteine protease
LKEVPVSFSPPIPSTPINDYLACSEIIDWQTPEIGVLAGVLAAGCHSEVEQAKRIYEWVRDEVPHSADAGHELATCRASEVLRHRTGICYAKAHLLAAMLRAVGIPSGMCYQVLRYDSSSERLVVHGLNGIYLKSVGRWIRVDSRGNKVGVNAQFSIEREQLAFSVNPACGEFTCSTVFAEPLPSVVDCLTRAATVVELMASLPSTIDEEMSTK